MNALLKKFKKYPFVKGLASVKITVACLTWLFVLTFWGTVAQVTDGLYLSQEKFFNSWYFLEFGFLPFPGSQLTLWILFFNLFANALFRFVYKWSHIGILIIHLGLLSYFVAAFVTLHAVEESNLTLQEGEASNASAAYHEWELSIWQESVEDGRKITAIDLKGINPGDSVTLRQPPLDIVVKVYYPNAGAFVRRDPAGSPTENISGINDLSSLPLDTAPEKNFPGGIFQVRLPDGALRNILLYGQEIQPTPVMSGGQQFYMQIRRKRFELPIVVNLKKFVMEKHPGTEMAKSYRSFAEIEHEGVKRDVEIYMNHPYRFKDYTFYQASYSVDQAGEYRSTLAVVKNAGRLLPYVASLVTFAGLAIHFLMMAFRRKLR